MKNCKEIKNLLIEYYYDEIEPSLKEEVRAHLDSCISCKKEYESIEKTLNHALEIKRPILSDSFKDDFYYGIKEKMNKKLLQSYKIWQLPVIVSICLLIIFVTINYKKNNIDEIDAIYMALTSPEISDTELSDEINTIANEVIIEELLVG